MQTDEPKICSDLSNQLALIESDFQSYFLNVFTYWQCSFGKKENIKAKIYKMVNQRSNKMQIII